MNMNSGYNGYSMSNRAVEAYEQGEMPYSKWSKRQIMESLEDAIEYEQIEAKFSLELFSKLNLNEMRNFLNRTSWHHTGSYCKETDFYSLDFLTLEELTNDKINEIILERVKAPRVKKEKEQVMYITAYVEYENWEGTRNHPKKVAYSEVVKYMSTDKMIRTNTGNKRLSSLNIIKSVAQKTKFANENKVIGGR